MKSRMLSLNNEKTQIANLKIVLVWLVSNLLLALTLCSSSVAQYETLPIHEDFIYPKSDDFATPKEYREALSVVKKRISTAKSAVTDAIKNGNANFGPDGDKYMLQYRLAAMTQTSDRYLSKLGQYRTDFLKLYMDNRASATVRRSVIGKLLPELKKIALGNYHPAVRINAVTIIGLLDQNAGDSGTPPIPSTAAYQALKEIWNNDSAPDAVRATAFSGIRRFAEISRRGEDNTSSVGDFKGELLSILDGKAKGQDKWQPAFDYWMKRRATQVLGYIGEGADVVNAVDSVMKTKAEPGKRNNFWLRYDGLEALANLNFKRLDSNKIEPLMDDVLGFVAEVLELEADYLQTQVDDLVYTNILWGDYDLKDPKSRRPKGMSGGGRSGGGRGGNPGGRGDDDGGISGLGGGGGGDGGSAGLDDGGRGGPPKGAGGGRGGGRGGFPGGGRGGGGRGGFDMEDRPHRVELPVFMMNDSRTRMKAVLVTALRFMDEPRFERGIVEVADDDTKTRIADQIVPMLEELIQETEVGVIDYKSKAYRNSDPEDIDVTHEMMELCRKKAKDVRAMISPAADDEVAAPGAAEDLNQ